MIQILKMSFDASGGMVGCGALPVSFDNAVNADTFMKHYLSLAFARGKSGYHPRKTPIGGPATRHRRCSCIAARRSRR